ncbi:MAG: riboflavin synthase [Gammaproteobacteria bacterium]|nr:riboflavin synthase [Gammaproteobacteria bacterium]MCH9763177.1 riboflavin synthase [Gammaproteobacteria bacterium]
MFTGLIESCGTLLHKIQHASGLRLVFEADFEQLVLGESIAVNGVCLTLVLDNIKYAGCLLFDISPETQALTNLGLLATGDQVHLERSLRASDRLGGHYVNGHVDTIANLQSITSEGDCIKMVIGGFTKQHCRYLCLKGSVTLDGVSLTINAVNETCISVMLIPHTLSKTVMLSWTVGQCINIEFDYIARVLVHQLGSLSDSTILSFFERPGEGKEVLV